MTNAPDQLPSWVDRTIVEEAATTYARLAPSTYASVAAPILNAIGPEHRAAATKGIRSLINNNFLFSAEPSGIVSASLFCLVMTCEGLLRPTLRALVEIAAAENTITGERLKKARVDLGMMITTLATEGRSSIERTAPMLVKQLAEWLQDDFAGLRNSAAHFKYQLEIVTKPDPKSVGLSKSPVGRLITMLMDRLGLGTSIPADHMVDSAESLIRYEPAIARTVSRLSKAMSFNELREVMKRLESVAAALQIGFIQGAKTMTAANTLVFAGCKACKQSNLAIAVPFEKMEIECPVCGQKAAGDSSELLGLTQEQDGDG